MTLDYNALAAWAAVVASLAAVIALWVESRRSRFSLRVDLMMKLEERFDSDEMRKTRRNAIQAITSKDYVGADEMLDFLELVGMLTYKKALDEQMVWAMFSYWVYHYYYLCADYITTVRKRDDAIWWYLVDLHARVIRIEKRENHSFSTTTHVTESSIVQFIQRESSL